MRKPRVILFDDDQIVLDVFRNFFALRNFEVLAFSEPAICPLYGDQEQCTKPYPCSDMVITDYRMPRMSGIELLEAQAKRGCKISAKNKAVVSGFLREEGLQAIRRLGVAYFEKPFEFEELGAWVDACESRIDLSRRIAIQRKERRAVCSDEVCYQLGAGVDVRRGVLVNRSTSGLCMKVDEPLRTDHNLTLHMSDAQRTGSAIIRWTKATNDNAYLIGLQYC